MSVKPKNSSVFAAAIAASQTSTSALPAPKLAARLAARKIPAADAKAEATPGKTICDARPTPLTILANCLWPRASSSAMLYRRTAALRAAAATFMISIAEPKTGREAEKRFDWPLCYEAENHILAKIEAFLERNQFARSLADRMLRETGTLF